MITFKILIEGYARYEGNELLASPTTTIVLSEGKRILVDPGANADLLLKSLQTEGLGVNDIDIVFLTHYHRITF